MPNEHSICALSFSVNASDAKQASVDYETCFDLEAGAATTGGGLNGCTDEGDITFLFNSSATNPALLLPVYSGSVALLRGIPFEGVNQEILADSLLFANSLGDPNYPLILNVPFAGTDTAIVLTAEGNYYKVGYAICLVNAGTSVIHSDCVPTSNFYGVRFWYELLK